MRLIAHADDWTRHRLQHALGWQLKLIRESLVDTKKAAEAANKAADAAERTVIAMKDTAERELRAYVMVLCAEIVKASPTTWIHITIKNFGQTPATAVTYTCTTCVKEVPLRTPLDGNPRPRAIGVIAPGDQWTARLDLPSMSSHDLTGRDTALSIYGEVRYNDGVKPDRVTSFRYMRRGGEDWSKDGEIETSPEGNDVT